METLTQLERRLEELRSQQDKFDKAYGEVSNQTERLMRINAISAEKVEKNNRRWFR